MKGRPQICIVPIETGVVTVHGPAEIPAPLVVAVDGVVVVQQVVGVVYGSVIAQLRRIRLSYGAKSGAQEVGIQNRGVRLRHGLVAILKGQGAGGVGF